MSNVLSLSAGFSPYDSLGFQTGSQRHTEAIDERKTEEESTKTRRLGVRSMKRNPDEGSMKNNQYHFVYQIKNMKENE